MLDKLTLEELMEIGGVIINDGHVTGLEEVTE